MDDQFIVEVCETLMAVRFGSTENKCIDRYSEKRLRYHKRKDTGIKMTTIKEIAAGCLAE